MAYDFKIDNFQDYLELCRVTLPSLGEDKDTWHFISGTLTELKEGKKSKDRVNELEEMGDALWYIAHYISLRGLTNSRIVFNDYISTYSLEGFVIDTWVDNKSRYEEMLDEFIDYVVDGEKKFMAYGTELDIDKIDSVIEYILYNFLIISEATFKNVCSANIAKLQKRFKGKFDAFFAKNRDIEAERALLEQKLG